MPNLHIIIEDVQVYDFNLEVPEGLSEDATEDFIWCHLAEHRDECWRSGEENIVAVDDITHLTTVPKCEKIKTSKTESNTW